MATSPHYAPTGLRTRNPIALPVTGGTVWLIGTVLFSLLLYYFIAIDEGAASVFGNHMFVHEFVHDSRHFLGFPCH